jgi:hypothetical protein
MTKSRTQSRTADVAKALKGIERTLSGPEYARPVPFLTATELADMLGLKPRAIQKRAQALGATRVGRVFLLTPAQAAQIQVDLAAPDKRGRKLHPKEI